MGDTAALRAALESDPHLIRAGEIIRGIGPKSGFANHPDPEKILNALAMGVRAMEEKNKPGCRAAVRVEFGGNVE